MPNKSDRIRALLAEGYTVNQISKMTGERYQFVRQVAYYVGKTVGQRKDSTHANSVSWVTTLTNDERAAIRWYTGQGYADLNRGLRKNLDFEHDETAARLIHLDSALAKAIIHETIMVYRGGRSTHFAELTAGDEFIDLGIGSTSRSLDKAKQFAKGAIFQIHLPTGTKCVDIDIIEFSSTPKEGEIIVARNTTYKVEDIGTWEEAGWREQLKYTLRAIRQKP